MATLDGAKNDGKISVRFRQKSGYFCACMRKLLLGYLVEIYENYQKPVFELRIFHKVFSKHDKAHPRVADRGALYRGTPVCGALKGRTEYFPS